MREQKPRTLHMGEAIFTVPESSLWDMRQAAKQAALEGKTPQRFIVTQEELYYPHRLDQMIRNEKHLNGLVLSLGDYITGELDGHMRCVALWESGWEGMLLHRNGTSLLCAYIPVMTSELALGEHDLAMKLAALAVEAQDTPVYLDKSIALGRRSIREILHCLSEQMDI